MRMVGRVAEHQVVKHQTLFYLHFICNCGIAADYLYGNGILDEDGKNDLQETQGKCLGLVGNLKISQFEDLKMGFLYPNDILGFDW